ncbi:FAD-linked oxidase C-terminal domain-containing protein, partial [Arhodomonas sp. KWT]
AAVRGPVTARGGHAALFAGGDRDSDVFQPLSPVLMRAHRRVKQAFDPGAILNPGRLYPE